VRRAQHLLRPGPDLRDAEVEHLHQLVGLAVDRRQEDVRRLEVAVHDAVRVRDGQRRRDGVDDAHDRRQRQRSFREPPLQVAALQVLHDEIRTLVGRDVEVEDLDDVGVAQLRHDLGFAAEARERLAVLGELG
jgi:hypothetical protein